MPHPSLCRGRGAPLFALAWSMPLLLASAAFASAPARSLKSPDGRIEVPIDLAERIRYDVLLRGRALLAGSTLSMKVDGTVLGVGPRVKAARPTSVDREIEPPVRQRSARIRERYNELRLELLGGYAVAFRAYDEGVAYRFETALGRSEVKVASEEVAFAFAGDYTAYYPKEESFFSHNEREFVRLAVKDIGPDALASLPAVVEAPEGVKIAIAESDVESYPGLWLRGQSGKGLSGTFPPYPLQEELKGDRDFKVVKAADYLAVTEGTRTFPWRILGIAEKDADLLTSSLVYLLARPSQLADTSWIRPGKVAWDWWNANNVSGVPFKSGVNTETYKYYIDFAARYGLEYVVLDEGWYPLGDLLHVAPGIDMEALTAYAREKKVGLVLWVVWKTLADQLEPALDKFEKWGIRGIKVDFMQRDDQLVVGYYHQVCREAAKRKMLVDFHGAIRPALMTRTWPNLISTEGVRGLEQMKWGQDANPEHDVTLPFTRMFLGPMDYTPGAMRNASQKSFAHIFEQPMSLGTRCHQLAMYVVYESPLQMLADAPSSYLREPEIMEFLGPVPSVWDETKVLDARLGDWVLVARRSGREWYVGAMTDWTARELEVDLSFLPAGAFRLSTYEDGVNADRYGSDYKKSTGDVSRESRFKISLAPGGGWAARIQPRD
jgi:alpha-glucosidase